MTNEFTEGENKDFTKVTLNVPVKLLKQFKTIADLNHYSRVAAMLEAMRQFIDDRTPEGYSEPDAIKTYWRQLMDAMLEILLNTPPTSDSDRVIYPGIMEYENEQERLENGIPLHKEVVDWFSSVSKSMNIDSVKLL